MVARSPSQLPSSAKQMMDRIGLRFMELRLQDLKIRKLGFHVG